MLLGSETLFALGLPADQVLATMDCMWPMLKQKVYIPLLDNYFGRHCAELFPFTVAYRLSKSGKAIERQEHWP